MVIRHWLCAVILALITMSGVARAQTAYKVDSSEHVGYLTIGSIGSSQTPPYWIRLTSGAGASYARVGVPLLIELRDTTSDSAFYGKFELDSVAQIVGDSLYVVKRALSNSSKYSWGAGTRAQIVNNNSIIISALRRSGAAIIGLPDTTGQAGKYLLDSANGVGPVWKSVPSTTVAGVASFNARTGVVVPVIGDYGFSKISGTAATTQGGTGLTSILPTKILYSPSSNTLGPLTLSSSFTITHDTLFGVGFQSKLPDTTGNADKVLKDSANGVGLIWSSAGAGTVQSVNVGGGLSGLTFANGPITTTGTIQISGGTLSIAYGGTDGGTRAQALTNLLPDSTGHTDQYLRIKAGGGFGWDTAVGGGGGGGGGGVTSVNVAIGGMTSSGAITTSGTVTMSGALAVANGGTALSTTPTNGKLLIGNGTNYTLANITGTSNEVTVTNGAGSITLATPQAIGTSSDVQFDSLTLLKPLPITSGGTGRSTVDTGALLYGYGTSTMASLAAGANGTVLQIASGLPTYTATLSSTVQGNITTLGTISSGTWSATTIGASKGGTGIASPTIHELLVGNGSSAMTQLAVGATNTVLHGHTGADPSFSAIATGDIIDSNVTAAKIATGAVDLTQQVSGVLAVANGGTGQSALAANDVLVGNGTGAATLLATANNGVLATNGSGVPSITGTLPSAVQTNITSLGTVATGTWNATTVAVNHGGTGAATLTGILFGNGTSAITGSHAVALTSEVTGVLPVASGGTNSAYYGGWFAFGNSNLPSTAPTASATDAIAIGDNIANVSPNSVMIGDNLTVNAGGAGQIVIGSNDIFGSAASNDITIIGRNNRVVDQKAIVIGVNDTLSSAFGQGAVLLGGLKNIMGSNNVTASIIAAGEQNSCTNRDAFILGGTKDTVGNQNSGGGAHFVGTGSNGGILGGTGLVVASPNQIALGQYNVPVPSGSVSRSDFWFIIGGGTAIDTANRTNSVAITGNSKIIVGGRPTVTTAGHTSWGSNTGQVKYGVAGSDFFAITTAASQAADRTYTIQDAGADGDYLFETSNLAATGSLVATTSTRGVLSSVPIGSSGQILAVAGGVPTWTAPSALTGVAAITTGSAGTVGSAALSSGAVTVSTTAVHTASYIFVTDRSGGANVGSLNVGSIIDGTSFVIQSSNVLDNSTVNWLIANP